MQLWIWRSRSKEPLPLAPSRCPNAAPHLLATLQARAPGQHRFETTLDRTLQATATAIVRERARTLGAQHVHNAAAVVIDNRTFEVLAYVGNSQWSVSDERSYAVDIVTRPRSTGSILKPLLYASMLEAGEILPHTLVLDVPTQYAGYMPENFDRQYRGVVPADVALAQSLNVPAVRMLKQHGVQRFYGFLQQAGMSTLARPPDDYGLTLILGGAEGTLWEISNQYANLAHIARQIYPGQPVTYRKLRVTDERCCGHAAPRRDRRRVGMADVARVARSFAARGGGALEELCDQPPDRVENGNELGTARCVVDRQYLPLHGRRVGRQCERRRSSRV